MLGQAAVQHGSAAVCSRLQGTLQKRSGPSCTAALWPGSVLPLTSPPPSPPAPHQHPPCPLHPAPPTPLTLYSNAAQLIGPFPLPMQAAVPQWGITSDTGCFCLRAPGHNAAEPCVASSTHPQSPAQPPPGPAPGRPTAPAGHQAIALRTANLRHTGAVHSAE